MNITFTVAMFMDHTILNGGKLPDRIPAHACWYYCQCAHKHLTAFDSGALYDKEDDHTEHLPDLVRNIARAYNCDPNQMMNYLSACRDEAIRLGAPWDARIEAPSAHVYRKAGDN